MSAKLVLFCVIVCFCMSTKFVLCQICTKQTMEISTKQISYTYTYIESYRTRCWYKDNCIKTRTRLSRTFKTVPSRHMKVINECCPGYIREDTDNDTITCKAICVPACVNGLCSQPGECSCFKGFSPQSNNSHECLPICDNECVHGTCAAPQTCSCNFGYSLFNGICQPICTEPCENGLCIAPDTCECLSGYRDVNGNCEPYCSQGCTHGVCIEPEECQCDPGYKDEDNQCVPNCEHDCDNGTCVGPNMCLCNPGFEYHDDSCQPICNSSCGSGICVGPDICECDLGYDLQNGTCQANCTDCSNGDCIEPEKCKCHLGYTSANNSYTCAPICINCEGTCIAPNKCECELPLIPKSKTVSNLDCDCFENCTDVSKMCVKTICFNPEILRSSPENPVTNGNDSEDYETFDDDDHTVNAEVYDQLTLKYEVETKTNSNAISNGDDNENNRVMTANSRIEGDNWLLSTGIYVIVAVLVLLALILLVTWVVIKKFFTEGSYVVENDHNTGCTAPRSIDLKLSSTDGVQQSV